MEEIRLGTIGSGVIVHSILSNAVKTPGVRLTAVYSRSEEKGRALADQYGAQKVYTALEQLFADEEVNFIYIASPNTLHYPQAKQALLAGKHVILEKPFCTKLSHAKELFAIAAERNLMLIEAVPPSFLPNLDILKRELPKIGRIRLATATFCQYSSRYDLLLQGQLPNNFNPEYAGGSFMDLNFYNIHLCTSLFGKPAECIYYPNMYRNIDTSGTAMLLYEDFQVQAIAAKDTWGENFVQIEGEKGYIYCKGSSSCLDEIKVVTKQETAVYNEQTTTDRWYYEIIRLVPLLLREDRQELQRRKTITLNTVEVMENARLAAGIRFPGDE